MSSGWLGWPTVSQRKPSPNRDVVAELEAEHVDVEVACGILVLDHDDSVARIAQVMDRRRPRQALLSAEGR